MQELSHMDLIRDGPPEEQPTLMIGKVASLYDITVQTLRHYDKIGLFRPEVVSTSTGYRYYSVKQLRELEYILFMRWLDMPLSDIQQAMDQLRQGKELTEVLTPRQNALEAEIHRLELQHSALRQAAEGGEIRAQTSDQVTIELVSPPRHYLLQEIPPLDVAEPGFALKLLEQRKELLGRIPPVQTSYSFGATLSLQEFRSTGRLCYTGILLDPGPYRSRPLSGSAEFPEGYYAAIRFHRDLVRPEDAYAKLSRFLEVHHFRTDDTILETGPAPSFASISRLSELTELLVHIYLD